MRAEQEEPRALLPSGESHHTPGPHEDTEAPGQARCWLQTSCLLLYPLRQARKKNVLGEEGWGCCREGEVNAVSVAL